MKKYSLILLTMFITSCSSGSTRQIFNHYSSYDAFNGFVTNKATRSGECYRVLDLSKPIELQSLSNDSYLYGLGTRKDYYAYEDIDYTLHPTEGFTFFYKEETTILVNYRFYDTNNLDDLVLGESSQFNVFPSIAIAGKKEVPNAFKNMNGPYYVYPIHNISHKTVIRIIYNNTSVLANRDYYSSLIYNAINNKF